MIYVDIKKKEDNTLLLDCKTRRGKTFQLTLDAGTGELLHSSCPQSYNSRLVHKRVRDLIRRGKPLSSALSITDYNLIGRIVFAFTKEYGFSGGLRLGVNFLKNKTFVLPDPAHK